MAPSPDAEDTLPPTWSDPRQVDRYLARIGGLAPRVAGEEVLLSLLPDAPDSVLDLECGDGRLTSLILEHRPSVQLAVAVDSSSVMLERARTALGNEQRVDVRQWNLEEPLMDLGSFDVVVAGFSIHHVEDDRKRLLFGEIAGLLTDGGVFANLEVVRSATPELHRQFLTLIGRTDDDPEDRLAPVEDQLQWMRDAGLTQVDCFWRWRGFALLAGSRR